MKFIVALLLFAPLAACPGPQKPVEAAPEAVEAPAATEPSEGAESATPAEPEEKPAEAAEETPAAEKAEEKAPAEPADARAYCPKGKKYVDGECVPLKGKPE